MYTSGCHKEHLGISFLHVVAPSILPVATQHARRNSRVPLAAAFVIARRMIRAISSETNVEWSCLGKSNLGDGEFRECRVTSRADDSSRAFALSRLFVFPRFPHHSHRVLYIKFNSRACRGIKLSTRNCCVVDVSLVENGKKINRPN